MNTIRTLALASTLAVAALGAQAAGLTVTPAQESRVHEGMTQAEVRSALGQPERVFHFAAEGGPTWAYVAPPMDDGAATFTVDFGADGRVVGVNAATDEID